MYIESNDMFTVDYSMHAHEQGYARIQTPALASAGGNQLLLFAEGRSNPRTAEERVVQNTYAAGDCDIVMRRSTDGGLSWDDQLTVIAGGGSRSEEHTSELQSLMRISYAVFCLKKKKTQDQTDI